MMEKYFAIKYCQEVVGWSIVIMFFGFWALVLVLYGIGCLFKKLKERRSK